MEETKQYTKEGLIERYLQRALTTDEKGLLHLFIAAASTFIDTYTNRSFQDIDDTDDVEATERLYDGSGDRELFIDDFTSLESIEFLDYAGDLSRTLLTTDYILYPLNSAIKNSIRLRSGCFPHRKAAVQVTGIFTSGETPKAIVNAATALVAHAITKATVDGTEFSSETIEGYSYTKKGGAAGEDYDKAIAPILKILDHYNKIQF